MIARVFFIVYCYKIVYPHFPGAQDWDVEVGNVCGCFKQIRLSDLNAFTTCFDNLEKYTSVFMICYNAINQVGPASWKHGELLT